MENYLKDFSLKDCHMILEKKFNTTNFTVKALKLSPSQIFRVFGEYCNIIIYFEENSENKSQDFFAKGISYSTLCERIFADENCGFIKECVFFENIVPDFLSTGINIISECVPRCYVISRMKYLIFDDMRALNYQTIDSRVCMNLQYLKLSLDAIAKLHCSGLIFEEKMTEKTGKAYRLSENYPTLLKESFFPQSESSFQLINALKLGTKAVINLMESESNLNSELFKHLTDDAFNNFLELVKPSNNFRNTICHGDLWSSNIFFKFEPNRSKPVHSYIFDFQTQRYSPPAQDVMSFIYLVTDQRYRQEHIDFLIYYYYEKVAEIFNDYNLSVENVLPYAEYIESCDYYKIYAISIAMYYHFFSFVPRESEEYVHQNTSKILFTDLAAHVLKFCAEDELYRRKSFENISDLRQAFIEKGLL